MCLAGIMHCQAQTIADVAVLPNTPTQAESLLHSLEQAAGGIGLHVNADKTKYMCLKSKSRHLHTKWRLPETNGHVHWPRKPRLIYWKWYHVRVAKAWTAIDWLSIIWKSDLADKLKRNFFHVVVVSILLYGCTAWTLTKLIKKRLDGNCKGCYEPYWTNSGSTIPQSNSYTNIYLPSLKPSKLEGQYRWDTAGKVRRNS